jgi:catechol 2,3-dioxygenase-like lactoylglutathione lyase family enzyme
VEAEQWHFRRAVSMASRMEENRPMALQLRGIDHVVLRVRDMQAMRRFYCDVLGAVHVAYRPEFRMSHLRAGAAMIAHDVAIGEIRERFGAEGNGTSIYVRDPEGNVVELKGPSDGKGPPAR